MTSGTSPSPRPSTCPCAAWSAIRAVRDGAGLPYTGDGPLVNSHPDFDGLHNREALERS
jgi:hypothetical protein